MMDGHPRQGRQVQPRLGRERGIDFIGNDAAAGADRMRDDGSVVSESAADVQHPCAGRERERVDPGRHRAWLAVEQVTRGIDGHGNVVVDAARIRVGRRPDSEAAAGEERRIADDAPRSRAQEALSRHRGERVDERRRLQLRDGLDLLGEKPPVLAKLDHFFLRPVFGRGPSWNTSNGTSASECSRRTGRPFTHSYAWLPGSRATNRSSPARLRRFRTV